MGTSFLDLPIEIITAILVYLPLRDLVACQRTCRGLKEVYSNSSHLQYASELEIAGMRDNPYCKIPVADRLEMLRKREDAWASMREDFVATLPVPKASSGVYDITPNVYLLGIASPGDPYLTVGVQSLRFNSDIPSPTWFEIRLSKEIVDFGTSIEEHDLLAAVITTHDQDRNFLEIALLRYSTGDFHDLAKQPVIPVTFVGSLVSISIEICGENLILVIITNSDVSNGTLRVYNWMKGTLKGRSRNTYNLGLVFLREDLFMTPCAMERTLDIFYIPPSSPGVLDGSLEIQRVQSLSLPALSNRYRISSLQCRCDPSPTAGNRFPKYVSPDRPFANDPEEALMILALDAQTNTEVNARPFIMLVHRKSLLASLPPDWEANLALAGSKRELPPLPLYPSSEELLASFNRSRPVPWENWGPPVTRWLNAERFASVFITSTAGQRFTNIAIDAPRLEAPISVLDFNPYHVRRAKALGELSPSVDTVVAGERPEDSQCLVNGVFEENITSELPFIELSTQEYYDYDAVLMDEQKIIGMKSSREPQSVTIDTVDVLHFG